jgi:hypothetical protein
MRVIDSEPQSWYLLEHDGDLFVDGNYDYGFVGYEFLLKLNAEERARFEEDGRSFIDYLTTRIRETVPIARGSASPFVGRSLSGAYGDQVLAAVKAWKRSRGE